MAQHKKFSFWKFTVLIGFQLTALLAVFRLALPSLWDAQMKDGWILFFSVFLGMNLITCFFEWFFHRYVLHSIVLRRLQQFADKHRQHHSLTSIRLQPLTGTNEGIIKNRFPIVEEDQYENAAFPWYALLVFWVLFTPLIIALQTLIPDAPILIAGYSAITWSLSCYEIFHAIEHLPYTWWRKNTENPYTGRLWKKIYAFHHMHHANIRCNDGISGFFGVPLADIFFRTYYEPKLLFLDGRVATAQEFSLPSPRRFVRLLDQWANRRWAQIRQSQSREQLQTNSQND